MMSEAIIRTTIKKVAKRTFFDALSLMLRFFIDILHLRFAMHYEHMGMNRLIRSKTCWLMKKNNDFGTKLREVAISNMIFIK